MINPDLTNLAYVKELQSNLRATFESPQGKETMRFLESACGWYPTGMDSMETNAIIARDANRKILGTVKTLLEHNAEDIVSWAKQEQED